MNFLNRLVNKLQDKSSDSIFELLKFLIIPSPAIFLPLINYIENFIIQNPIMIYVVFIVPAFLFGLCLYSLIKTKEKYLSKIHKINAELVDKMQQLNYIHSYERYCNVLWNRKGEPHCLNCKSPLVYRISSIMSDISNEYFDCFTCKNSVHLYDEDIPSLQTPLPFKTAKDVIIRSFQNKSN